MKKLTTLAATLLLAFTTSAGIMDVVSDFFAANPTNSWDVSTYGLKNVTSETPGISGGLGAGARIGYWLTPFAGVALDGSYCDSSWTFASLGIAARGTFRIGTVATVTPYVTAGPGWNIQSDLTKEVVAVAGAGASVTWTKYPSVSAFGEYVSILTDKQQNRVQFGLTKRF